MSYLPSPPRTKPLRDLPLSDFIPVRQAAEAAGCSLTTMYSTVRELRVLAFRRRGRLVVHPDSLDHWIRQRAGLAEVAPIEEARRRLRPVTEGSDAA